MKVTQKQIQELLKAAGLQDVEIVDDESSSDYDQDTALQAIDGSRSAILKPQWAQEQGENAMTAAAGNLRGILTGALVKATGIRRNELDKHEKLEDRIAAATEYMKSLHEGDSQSIQSKIDGILSEHNSATESLKSEYEKQIGDWKTKYSQKELSSWAQSQLKDAPILDTADRSVAAGDFYNHLANKYHIEFDEESKGGKLFDKSNPTVPALNAAKTAGVDLMAEAKEYFTPRGLWQTDMRHKNPAQEMNNRPQGGAPPQYTPPAANQPNSRVQQMNEAIAKM